MADLDELARTAVDGVLALAGRAMRFAARVFAIGLLVAVVSFAAGLAALSGDIRSVWAALGIVFGVLGIGGAALAWWRLRSLRRHRSELTTEVRSAMEGDPGLRTRVIETVEAGERSTGGGAVMVWSRQFGTIGDGASTGDRWAGYRRLPEAIKAVTTFPLLILGAIAVTIVFAACGLVFLLALAL